MRRPLIYIILLVLIVSSEGACGETVQEKGLQVVKGLEIAIEADRRDDGFGDSTGELRMTLKNRRGKVSTRKMRMKTLEVEGDGDKSIIVFDNPRDVKGTAVLTFTHKSGDDDQWLYLPALKRVKRISSSNKSGSFMGSEFSYEDIASQEVEKYTYKYLGEEPCPGQEYSGLTCFVVESYPVFKRSGYTRIVSWIDSKEYRDVKADFYDRKESLLKTLTFSRYKLYLDQYWRANELYMINHQTGKSTRLVQENLKLRTGLNESDFTTSSLRRAK